MKEYIFTDDQLESYVENNGRDMTSLERELAFTIQKDREAFRKLMEEIEPMARQIIDPPENVFTRQLTLIRSRLSLRAFIGFSQEGETK